MRALPRVGWSRSSRVRIVVVLPAPLGPRKPKTSPASTAIVTSSIPRRCRRAWSAARSRSLARAISHPRRRHRLSWRPCQSPAPTAPPVATRTGASPGAATCCCAAARWRRCWRWSARAARRALRRRPGRDHHLLDPRRQVRLRAALGPRPLDRGADRLPRARGAAGDRHRQGLLTLVRERYGRRAAALVLAALVIANTGTLCAEFAGVAAGMELLGGMSRYISVPLAAIGVSVLVLRENFRHVEHFLLALSSVFVAYVISGVLAHPDWGAAAKGLVVPSLPLNREAVLVAVATVGTTLAPWGLAFIQSYAVDKKLQRQGPALRAHRRDRRRRADRRDRLLRRRRLRGDAARPGRRRSTTPATRPAPSSRWPATRRRPSSASASSAPPCSRRRSSRSPPPTRSPRPSAGKPTSTTASRRRGPSTSATALVVIVAAVLVLIPGAPLIPILFLSQALNAVLLLVLLPFMRSLGRDRELMGSARAGARRPARDRDRPGRDRRLGAGARRC